MKYLSETQNQCCFIDSSAQIEELSTYRALLCVISTTGDGEPPDNARPFFRVVRKLINDHGQLAALPYAVLGLGDTNYSKFARPAKDIDSMLASCGAYRFFATGLADDGVGCVYLPCDLIFYVLIHGSF